jgi:hypothetical protein
VPVTDVDGTAPGPSPPTVPAAATPTDEPPARNGEHDAAHELVRDALRRGVTAAFAPPGEGTTTDEPHGDDLPPYDDDQAWAGRTVDGAWLAELLCGGDEVRAPGRGVAVRGARIVGGLPLDGAELPFRLDLAGCQLGDRRVLLRDARTRTVRLAGVRCGGIEADRAHVGGALLLQRAGVHGPVRLVDARVDASVECDGATLDAPGGTALTADRAHIAGSLILREGFRATGKILLEATTIGGALDAGGARLHDPGPLPRPLRANGAQVAASVFLNGGCTVTGPVEMFGIRIGRDLLCTGGRFTNPGGDALSLNGARIEGKLMLRHATVTGRVRINNGAIGGDLVCGGAHLTGSGDPAQEALSASRATIGGHAVFDHGFVARGEVRLMGTSIAGTLRCASARLEGTRGVALSADSATVGEAVALTDGFTARGTVRLAGITVGAAVDATGAHIDAPGLGDDGPGGDHDTAAGGGGGGGGGGGDDVGGGDDAGGGSANSGADDGTSSNAGHGPGPGGGGSGDQAGGGGGGDGPDGTARSTGGTATGPGTAGMALDLRGGRITGGVNLLDGFTARGEVRLTRTTVGGHVDCSGATLANPGGIALRVSGARVMGGIYLQRGCRVDGEIRLPGATIGRDVLATAGGLHNPGGTVLRLTRAQVAGDVIFGRGLTTTGRVLLARAGIGGNLDCSGGTFSHRGLPTLDLPNAEVGGTMLFSASTRVTGRVHLGGAVISGDLDFDGARIANDEDVAISAANARVTGGLMVHGTVTGGVQVRGIVVGGDLDCRGAHLVGTPERPALGADRAQITGGLMLTRGFRAEGRVQLRSCEIGGHASCVDGTFSNPGATALTMGGSRIGSDLGLDRGFSAEGAVRLGRIAIGSDLICTGGRFDHPDGTALRLAGAHVTGVVWLDDGFAARGVVELAAATVGGDVRCEGGRFENPGDEAIDASGARIAGSLSLHRGFHADGTVVLRNASAGTLHDDAASWPDRIDLDGFRYERLACPTPDRGWRQRSLWLRRQQTPSALGYVQLAAVYRAAGDDLRARRILIDRYNAELRPPPHWVDQLPGGLRYQAWKLWRWVLRLTIGHGFSPARSLVIGLPLAAVMALWLGHGAREDMLIPTDETAATSAGDGGDGGGGGEVPRSSACDDRYPCVQPVVYALDNLVPIVDLGQRSSWSPDQSHRGPTWRDDGRWLSAATWTTSALGWVLATLVAASFTQIIRRE